MFYREAGDFHTSYGSDNQTIPIKFDRYRYYAVRIFAIGVVPFVINDYWANAILLPFLIYSIAAIGLNILTGYEAWLKAGQPPRNPHAELLLAAFLAGGLGAFLFTAFQKKSGGSKK